MPRPREIEWRPEALMMRAFIVGARKLAITLVPECDTWIGVAVESSGTGVSSVLEQHGHKALPPHEDLRAAMDAADAYGLEWTAAATAAIPACECEDIPELVSEGRPTSEQLEAMFKGEPFPADPTPGDPTP
jgi:dissimilatory sulfite reductase (desulfoviridin) alpha/beta subunit